MDNPQAALKYWFPDAIPTIDPVVHRGFSGARVWRVQHDRQPLALRSWPRSAGSPCRLGANLALQDHLANDGLPIPRPVLTSNGSSIVTIDRQSWGLATWLPGLADYWDSLRPAKLQAAFATLAQVHDSGTRITVGGPKYQPRTAASPALLKRSNRLNEFVTGEFYQLGAAVGRHTESSETRLAKEALSLIQRTAAAQLEASWRWRRTELPLQWCMRDIWHDHVLFTGDRVTGIIDFDAAAIDSPAGDVARLLGSMVGDDPAAWQTGLVAYKMVRPLAAAEREAICFFDSSGVVLSAVNWVNWLFRDPSVLSATVDRAAAVERLERLTARLRTLAATSRG